MFFQIRTRFIRNVVLGQVTDLKILTNLAANELIIKMSLTILVLRSNGALLWGGVLTCPVQYVIWQCHKPSEVRVNLIWQQPNQPTKQYRALFGELIFFSEQRHTAQMLRARTKLHPTDYVPIDQDILNPNRPVHERSITQE